MKSNLSKLTSRSRVAIVGGGPAGSFMALYILHFGQLVGIRPQITIYQRREFSERGPKGCKGCAGILAASFLQNLTELKLEIPKHIIQNWIFGYTVHSPYGAISISNPEKRNNIASVYRGAGPIVSDFSSFISFDGWLLGEAQQRGARVENDAVTGIILSNEVYVEIGDIKEKYDLVVLAAGASGTGVTVKGNGYRPPATHRMVLMELHAGSERVGYSLGEVAHAFLLPRLGMVFGTLVPKGPFINVSVLSHGKEPLEAKTFLEQAIVQDVLPTSYTIACQCQPHAVVRPARQYYGDGFVAIGDSAVTRLYKDGIGSALLTARAAANTAINWGVSTADFRSNYLPVCRAIIRNNRWGRMLFSLNDITKNSPAFLYTQQRLISREQSRIQGIRPFTKAAWGMFTGTYSYVDIASYIFHPLSLLRIGWNLVMEGAIGLLRHRTAQSRRLYVGSRKVLILGNGFGGTYVLRHLVPALNRNENVEITMVSEANYFLFSPLLHEVATGRVETRHIAYPIRRLHWRDRFNFVHANVKDIDFETHQVLTSSGILNYDYLVLALGSITDTSELKGSEENVFFLKTLHDAMLLKNHIISLFERAVVVEDNAERSRLLTFIIAGAGYTGVQLVAELKDMIDRHLLRFYRSIKPDMVKIFLIEAESRFIASLDKRLGTYVMRFLRQNNIAIRFRSKVTRVNEAEVEINGEETIPTRTIIWMTGIVASPRVAELDVAKDEIGRVNVNNYLEIPEQPNVFAIGDCARINDPMTGTVVAPLAHNAVRQAKVVAHNILAEIRGAEKKIYRYAQPPQMVSLGATSAVMRFHKLRFYGRLAAFIWLVGYTLLVTGHYNRIRIVFDRLLSAAFGRDTTLINLKK